MRSIRKLIFYLCLSNKNKNNLQFSLPQKKKLKMIAIRHKL